MSIRRELISIEEKERKCEKEREKTNLVERALVQLVLVLGLEIVKQAEIRPKHNGDLE